MSAYPLFNLDSDIILTICDIITSEMSRWHTQGERPLDVVRVASQVCRQWREVLLSSPWIWGRLIDLDGNDYGLRRIEWMDEVVRRAGSAPLWIYGHVRKGPKVFNFDTQSYFIRLLVFWERIEKLSVWIYRDEANINGKLPDEIRISFLSRAPILKLFCVYFTHEYHFLDSLQPGPPGSLFADYAPSLRTMQNSQVAFKLDSPWLSNIREILPFPLKFTMKEVFTILQRTPAIESIGLNAKRLFWDREDPPFPKLILPKLSSITLRATLPGLARILDYIHPIQLSTLCINVWDETVDLSDPYILSSVKENLAFYISRYFTPKSSTAVIVAITKVTFRLCDLTNIIDVDKPNMEIVIQTHSSQQPDWESLVSGLLDTVTRSYTLEGNSSFFTSITRIRLTSLEVQSTTIQKLHSMFAIFQHVKHMETTEYCGHTLWTLACLDAGGNPQHVLFPELQTLHLLTIHSSEKEISTDLTKFFLRRKSIGYPVAKLDLTECDRSNYAQDLRDLDAVHGLEVVWKKKGTESEMIYEISSYVCGTGNPDELRGLV